MKQDFLDVKHQMTIRDAMKALRYRTRRSIYLLVEDGKLTPYKTGLGKKVFDAREVYSLLRGEK